MRFTRPGALSEDDHKRVKDYMKKNLRTTRYIAQELC